MSKYITILPFVAIALGLVGCVTMNNYRSTKAQMLVGEVEIHHRNLTIDSLNLVCDSLEWRISRLDSIIVGQHSQINSLSVENNRLKEEYALLMDELKKQETKKNAVQKSSSKTKR